MFYWVIGLQFAVSMAHRSWRLERNEPFRYSIYHGCRYDLCTFSDTISGAVGVESTCCSWGRISAAAIDYLTLDSR